MSSSTLKVDPVKRPLKRNTLLSLSFNYMVFQKVTKWLLQKKQGFGAREAYDHMLALGM